MAVKIGVKTERLTCECRVAEAEIILRTARVVDLLVAMATSTSSGSDVTLGVDVTTYVTGTAGAS